MAVREREAVRMFADALGHHRNNELEEAARLYGRALILNPNIPDIYNNLGVALRALGKLEASAACYHRALALSPDNAGAYTNLGNVLRGLGRFEAAVASHRRAWGGLMGSIYPAMWSFQLALRARGLGSVLTTLHLQYEDEAAALLGIPDGVIQAGLLPVAYTIGTDFKPAKRRPLDEIVHWEKW